MTRSAYRRRFSAGVTPPDPACRVSKSPLHGGALETHLAADSLAALLAQAGHQTWTACDGAGALRAAEAARPDVLLLDLGLPDQDG